MTVAFYRDILKLEGEEKAIDNLTVSKTHQVKFGNNVMWLDCVDNYTHSETWLELNVSNVDTATKYLNSKGVETCDEPKQLPENMHQKGITMRKAVYPEMDDNQKVIDAMKAHFDSAVLAASR